MSRRVLLGRHDQGACFLHARPVRADVGQGAETLDAEFILDVGGGPYEIVEEFAREGRADAEAQAADDAADQEEDCLRRALLVRLGRGADDAGFADREAFLLGRLLQLVQEGVVKIAIGVRSAFQVAQLDLRLAAGAGLIDQAVHVAFKRTLAALGDLVLAPIGIGDAPDLIRDRFSRFVHAARQVDRGLVIFPVLVRPVSILRGEIEILGSKPRDDGVAESVGNRRLGEILVRDGVDPVEARLGFRGRGARLDQLGGDIAQLLLAHQAAAGADDVVLGLEGLHGAIGLGGLVAQFQTPLL